MKKFLFLAMVAALVTSCEKDPDLNKLDNDLTVYTNYDNEAHFDKFATYYLPDSVLLAGNGMKAVYWKDDNAQKIIAEVAAEMDSKGYKRVDKKEEANVGLQLFYAQKTTHVMSFVGGGMYDWWGSGYWGPFWSDWYYPYPVSYSYDTGTLVMEMVDLTAKPEDASHKMPLPVIWHSYASGLLFGNSHIDMQLTLRAVDQAFRQSPYITKK